MKWLNHIGSTIYNNLATKMLREQDADYNFKYDELVRKTLLLMTTILNVLSMVAAVEIQIYNGPTEIGKDLTLLCKIENCCSSETKRWYGGSSQKLLMLNSGESTNKNKYMTKIQKDGLVLIIKNLSESDLNVKYECSYGFDRADLNLTYETVFNEMPGPKEEQNTQDSDKSKMVVAIIGGCVGAVLVILVAVISICIRKRRKRRVPSDNDAVSSGEIEQCLQDNNSFNQSGQSSGEKIRIVRPSNDSPKSNNQELHSTENKSPCLLIPKNEDTKRRKKRPQFKGDLLQFNENLGRKNINHPEYKNCNLRIRSFAKFQWPITSPSVEEMAKAGFFYLGEGTTALCHCCGIGREWYEGDNPFDGDYHEVCKYIQKRKESQP